MTNEERVAHYRRWQLLVKWNPNKYRIFRYQENGNFYVCLKQYFHKSPDIVTYTRLDGMIQLPTYSSGKSYVVIEELPTWCIEEAQSIT